MTASSFRIPRQPAAANPFEPSYAPVTTTPGGYVATPAPTSKSSANPFELYDANVDDDGAETGNWESEPTGTRSEPRFWQPRFYAAYFDITISDLTSRLFRAFLPCKPLLGWTDSDEELEGGTSVPDLYGPVWVTTTLVLALSMGSKMAEFLANVFRKKETQLKPSIESLEFSRLWKAAGLLYGYVFVFPVLLTVFQCLFAKRALGERAHPVLGTVMVYGYSLVPVVVAALVATIPIEMVQIIAMCVAFSIGAAVIVLNLWRDVSVEHKSLTYFVRLLAVGAHAAVGAGVIFIFYVGR